jgi:osmoprotectant transport system ATP-binding protein
VPRLLGWDRRRIDERVDELLNLVGLDAGRFARRFPHQLSGGQRQRVGVARALAADPPVLLMDEPFGAIDPITRDRLQGEFVRLQQELRKTVVFVTHDVDEAIRLGDRIAVLAEGGRLAQYAPATEVLGAPASPFVADFVGADRGIKRLSVLRVTEADVTPGSADGLPAIDVGTTLRDALAAMLAEGQTAVAVRGPAGALGVLSADALFTAAGRA